MVLLIGALWSVVRPTKRIWPPPERSSWQYRLTWACFYLAFGINAALFILDWNSWIFISNLRLIFGIPLAIIGFSLVAWGSTTLGMKNTSGLMEGIIVAGPYRFTRNPQYMGDMLLFLGLSVIANSLYLWIAHLLLILIFLIAPLAEEDWLEEQYGDAYLEYKKSTSRFL